MKKRPLNTLLFGLLTSLTATNAVQSAAVSASSGATIVVPVNVSASASAACAGPNDRCHSPVVLPVENDGTLNGPQGVSLSLTREVNVSNAVKATLAYD